MASSFSVELFNPKYGFALLPSVFACRGKEDRGQHRGNRLPANETSITFDKPPNERYQVANSDTETTADSVLSALISKQLMRRDVDESETSSAIFFQAR